MTRAPRAKSDRDSRSGDRGSSKATLAPAEPSARRLGNLQGQSLLRDRGAAPDGVAGALGALASYVSAGRGPRSGSPQLHEDHISEAILDRLATPGLTVGQHMLLSRRLVGARRSEVLRHELGHAAQTGGRNPRSGARLRLGPRGDSWERGVGRTPEPRGSFADPQVVRRFEPGAGDSEEGVCEAPPLSAEPDEAACTVDPEGSGDGDGLTGQEVDPASAVCEPANPPSFYADDIDVPGLRNDELNVQSLRVDDWFTEHGGEVENPDRVEYTKLRARLKRERTERVQQGHLWLAIAERTAPRELYMLMPGGDRTHIISVHPEIALGVPDQSYPGPIMTVDQFRDQMSGMGIPIISHDEYLRRLEAFGARMDSGTSGDLSAATSPGDHGRLPFGGYVGGVSLLDLRARGIAQLLPYRSAKVRGGDLAEAFFLTSRSNLYGWAATDYNRGRAVYSGDPFSPLRRTRGNVPYADVAAPFWMPFEDVSIKMNLPGTERYESPSLRKRQANFLEGHARMLETSAHRFQSFQADFGGGRSAAEITSGIVMAIPADEFDAYQAMIRDPMGYDRTESGNRATKPNYEMKPLQRIYDLTPLPRPVTLPDGTRLRTGADVRATFDPDTPEFESYMRTIGEAAAASVVPIHGFDADIARFYESYRATLPESLAPRDIRSWTTPEVARSLEYDRLAQGGGEYVPRGTRSSLRVGARYAPRGAGLGAGTSVLFDLVANEDADLADPAYREYLRNLAIQEGARGGISEFAEASSRAGLGRYALQEGLEATAARSLLLRGASRASGGLGDVAIETYQMLSDEREQSGTEATVRITRAAVIGGTSAAAGAWAGATAGAAAGSLGGPVGFVVGFAVGALVGWGLNALLPGGREDWERREQQRRRIEEMEARVARLERLVAEIERRRQRSDTLLQTEAAGVVDVTGLPPGHAADELFLSSSPESAQLTVGDLEHEYIRAILDARAPMTLPR